MPHHFLLILDKHMPEISTENIELIADVYVSLPSAISKHSMFLKSNNIIIPILWMGKVSQSKVM